MIYLEFILGFIVVIGLLIAFAYKRKKVSLKPVRYEDVPKLIRFVAEKKMDAKKIRGIEMAFWKQAVSRTKKVRPVDPTSYEKLDTTQQRSVYKIITGSLLPLPKIEFKPRTVEEILTIYMNAKEQQIKGKDLVRKLSS